MFDEPIDNIIEIFKYHYKSKTFTSSNSSFQMMFIG